MEVTIFSLSYFLSTRSIFHSLNQYDIRTAVCSVCAVFGTPVFVHTFLSVPFGWHTILFYLYCVVVNGSLVFLFRLVSGDRVPPFLYIYHVLSSMLFSTYFYKIPFFRHRDERDGKIERYGLGLWFKFPKWMRHDVRLRNESDLVESLVVNSYVFSLLYPIVGGVFFQANLILQACLIPVFFALRSWYEYACNASVTSTFGSDKFPLVGLCLQ